jgi:two-component system chemotaxis sensor kinase CheA
VNEEQLLFEAFLSDANEVLEEWVRESLKMTEADGVEAYRSIMRCAHNLKGAAGVVGFSTLQEAMHKIEDHVIQLRDQSRAPDSKVVALLLATEKFIQSWLEKLKSNPKHNEDTTPLESAWHVLLTKTPAAASTTAPAPAPEQPAFKQFQPTAAQPQVTPKSEGSIRIAVTKLDKVTQLAGEVCLHQAILARALNEGTLNALSQRQIVDLTTKLLQDLQDAVLDLRMIPLETLFQKIDRVIKETSAALDREVRIQFNGGEVPLDKMVIEGMFEPMVHLARNAIDHGLEPKDERTNNGKPPAGQLILSAENAAGSVRLTFEDDGRGINAEKVYQQALQKGLVSNDKTYSEADKMQMIFLPGLSTADKVTQLSGRGVGMDVVNESVKRMGGRLEIDSQLGKGTRFVIYLPTNLSILNALVIKIGSSHYAVPNQDLAEIINLNDHDQHQVDGGRSRAINLRGTIIPIENLAGFLSVKPESSQTAGIVVQHRDRRLALAVENVIGQQQIFVRPLPGHLASIGFFGGSTILSDGEPTLILNLPEIVRQYFAVS